MDLLVLGEPTVAVVTALVEILVEYADAHSDVSLVIVLTSRFAVGNVLITVIDGGVAVDIDAVPIDS